MRAKAGFWSLTGCMAALAVASGVAAGVAHAGQITLSETGSTLLYPLFGLWAADYQSTHPGLQITTEGTGSGTGIVEAVSGKALIGASDAYMTDTQVKASPGIMNIPLAISSQMINYNIPGLNDQHLKFSGLLLSAIYGGTVKYWDDPMLAELNPGVKLPHQAIIPIHRSDGSGDTFIFTQFLSSSTPAWSSATGFGTTVNWPVPGIAAEGNKGMVSTAKATPYSIAYIGISFKKETGEARLGEAMLQNRDGKFVLPDARTVGAAVQQMSGKTPADERISLIFAPGIASYPIINYEYAIIRSHQPSPDVATALKNFLGWIIDPKGGNAAHYMQSVGFVPLPGTVLTLSNYQINQIQ
jgi:phosphate transport system substrate-binding protein